MCFLFILCGSLVTLPSWFLLYNLGRDLIENPASYIVASVSVSAKNLFNAPLPSNARIHSFQYSGFRPSCHNITTTLEGEDVTRQVTSSFYWRISQAQHSRTVRLFEWIVGWKVFLQETAQNFNCGVNNLIIAAPATKFDSHSESIRFLQARNPLSDWRKCNKNCGSLFDVLCTTIYQVS
jgi:hypothetical protein